MWINPLNLQFSIKSHKPITHTISIKIENNIEDK